MVRSAPSMPARILVVDDSPLVAEGITRALSRCGYSVTTAGCAADAEAQMGRGCPDLILIDVWLPQESGLSFVRRMRQSAQYRSIPVIFMSGMSDPRTIAAANSLGAESFLTKPLELSDFVGTISRVLAQTK